MNKGILVIGGGLLQERAIACCKKLKFKVFLIDGSKNCYCKNLVDNFYHIDCYDLKRILKLSNPKTIFDALYGIFHKGLVAISPVITVFGFQPKQNITNNIIKIFFLFKNVFIS